MVLRFALVVTFAISTGSGANAQGAEKANALEEIGKPPPVRLIGARCVFCHGAPLMLGFSRRMLDKGGTQALDAFLATHHAPDTEAREAIVQFLSQPF